MMKMRPWFNKIFRIVGYVVVASVIVGINSLGHASSEKTYDFTVFLEDDEIGSQRFVVSQDGARTQIDIEATFDVTFAFITVYTYRHHNSEIWEGDCLQNIQAKTDDNGEKFFVNGRRENDQMQFSTHSGKFQTKDCVKTYAYWEPDWFQSDRLLNSQTGVLDPVTVKMIGKETISVRGVPTLTSHHQIISEKFTVDLWYTLDKDWVALHSTTEEGRTLRYQLR